MPEFQRIETESDVKKLLKELSDTADTVTFSTHGSSNSEEMSEPEFSLQRFTQPDGISIPGPEVLEDLKPFTRWVSFFGIRLQFQLFEQSVSGVDKFRQFSVLSLDKIPLTRDLFQVFAAYLAGPVNGYALLDSPSHVLVALIKPAAELTALGIPVRGSSES